MSFSILEISVIVFCAGGVFFILLRKIPVVALIDEKKEKESVKVDASPVIGNMQAIKDKSFFKFKIKIGYRKSIIRFACFLEKILRKLRLVVLKADNFFNKWITFLRENTKNNSKNLSMEKSKLFDYKMRKFREAAQKWQSHAYQMIEDGVGRSLVMMTPDNSRNKKVIIKKDVAINQKKTILQVQKTVAATKTEIKAAPIVAPAILKTEPSVRPYKLYKPVVVEDPKISIEPKTEIFEEEHEYIEKIAKNPRDVEAYRKLGKLYVVQKNYSDALASFMEIVKNKKNDIEAQDMILKIRELMRRHNF